MDRKLAEAIVKRLTEAGAKDVSLFENYSGRGMFGEKTTGVSGPNILEITFHAGQLADFPYMPESYEEAALTWDQLGIGYIVY